MNRIINFIGTILITMVLVPFTHHGVCHAKQPKTIKDFESSTFYNKYKLKNKRAYDLTSGGMNNVFQFVNPEYTNGFFSVEMTTVGSNIEKISITWFGEARKAPLNITRIKSEIIKEMTFFWGAGAYSNEIEDFARKQQAKKDSTSRQSFGPMMIEYMKFGQTLSLVWQ